MCFFLSQSLLLSFAQKSSQKQQHFTIFGTSIWILIVFDHQSFLKTRCCRVLVQNCSLRYFKNMESAIKITSVFYSKNFKDYFDIDVQICLEIRTMASNIKYILVDLSAKVFNVMFLLTLGKMNLKLVNILCTFNQFRGN